MAGRLEILAGPMFSGKSSKLLRRLRREEIAKHPVQLFKPSLDTRYEAESVVTHDQLKAAAVLFDAKHSSEILEKVSTSTTVVGIDEAQWSDSSIVQVVETLVSRGVRVLMAGLDQDYLGKPFGPMPQLMAVADDVAKLKAVCTECGEPASKTQRLVASTDQIVVGGTDKYAARCRAHHTV